MASHLITGDELKRLSGGAKIMTYSQLTDYPNLSQAFGKSKKIALLYVNKQDGDGTSGHWTSLIRRGDEIECSDPYNYKPDHQFEKIEDPLDQTPGSLSSMLIHWIDNGGKVTYNEKSVQSRSPDISTCGRHVGLRLFFDQVPLKDFQKQMKRIKDAGKSTDDFAIWWSKKKIGV